MVEIIAHGVHIGLVALGLFGLAVLLMPGLRGAAPSAWQPPATEDEHVERVTQLRRQIAAGRLGVVPAHGPPAATSTPPLPDSALRTVASRPDAVLLTAAASLGAAGLHAEAFHQHLVDGLLVSAFFATAALAQAGWAWAALARPLDRALARLGAVGNVGLLLVWTLTRTTGLGPLAPAQEPGLPDLLSVCLELLIVAICMHALRRPAVGR